jgi:hypothetical protein
VPARTTALPVGREDPNGEPGLKLVGGTDVLARVSLPTERTLFHLEEADAASEVAVATASSRALEKVALVARDRREHDRGRRLPRVPREHRRDLCGLRDRVRDGNEPIVRREKLSHAPEGNLSEVHGARAYRASAHRATLPGMTGAEILTWARLFAEVLPLAADLVGALRRLVAGEDPAELAAEYAAKTKTLVEEIQDIRLRAEITKGELALTETVLEVTQGTEKMKDDLETTPETLAEWLADWNTTRARAMLRSVGPDESRDLAVSLHAAFVMRPRIE